MMSLASIHPSINYIVAILIIHPSLACNSRLTKSITSVRLKMSDSIFLLIINFMSWGSFPMISVYKSDPQLLLSIPRFQKFLTFDLTFCKPYKLLLLNFDNFIRAIISADRISCSFPYLFFNIFFHINQRFAKSSRGSNFSNKTFSRSTSAIRVDLCIIYLTHPLFVFSA